MMVKTHHGCNGTNVKFTTIEKVAMRIPSKRAQAASEKTPKPAATPMMPPIKWIQPQVPALVVIKVFAPLI